VTNSEASGSCPNMHRERRICHRATSSAGPSLWRSGRGAGAARKKDHIHLHLEHLPADVLDGASARHCPVSAYTSPASTPQRANPVIPTVHYVRAAFRETQAEVINPTKNDTETVGRIMAIG